MWGKYRKAAGHGSVFTQSLADLTGDLPILMEEPSQFLRECAAGKICLSKPAGAGSGAR